MAGRALFGSCRWIISEWLPRFGVETTYVDATDLNAWKNAVRPNTKVFLVESPANPLLEVTDVAAVAEIAGVTTAKVEPSNVSGPTQVIYNYTNWIVCSETPAAGDDITPGTEIEVDVRRPATECPE